MEFRPDGTFAPLMIGRGDAPSPGPPGRWDPAGRLHLPDGTGRIVSSAPDRLEIAWQDQQ
ncbi:hypothetical protein OHA18_27125 [Kribbella sp. NBC_00709]|uniref:hypothetical protein n=1 Tax=Kribbella sp. NBC_00709 TaxID=2975972 RepID=UPI002E2A06A8|nr:hypothetical protein [Kribbella sp. NBC_00709]